jgi:hypothetical protein
LISDKTNKAAFKDFTDSCDERYASYSAMKKFQYSAEEVIEKYSERVEYIDGVVKH